ncbi:MAG: DUF4150 domain-containing protein [Planctomycetota bacterium]
MIFPVMCVASGQCVAFPDVCFTPAAPSPVPLPYPNIAIPADGDGTDKVKTMNSNTLRKGDAMSKSTGDNAGSAPGGTVSGMMMGKVEVKTGSNKVKADGKETAYHTVITSHNGTNANNPAGGHVLPTNVKVKVVGTPGCPGSGLDALKNGGFIAVGAQVVSGAAGQVRTGDPVTDAQQSMRCCPELQNDLGQMQNPAVNPKANGFNVQFGSTNGTMYSPQTGGITLGQSWQGAPPNGLTGIISHELGHAQSHMNGTSPAAVAGHLPGESLSAYANRMTNESLREEGRAAMRNIRARREAQQNCPNQPPPHIDGDNQGTFGAASQQPDPEGAIAAQYGQNIPDLPPGHPPGTNYQQYYHGAWTSYGQSLGLI